MEELREKTKGKIPGIEKKMKEKKDIKEWKNKGEDRSLMKDGKENGYIKI